MNVHIFILCGNEETLIRHTIKHYVTKFPSATITILDNESTDNSVQIAKELGCTVHSWSSNNIIDDYKYLELKNNFWKKVKEGWVIICDMDEWLDIDEVELMKEDKIGTTILKTQGYNIVASSEKEDLSDIDLHSIFEGVIFNPESKNICFKVPSLHEIGFTLGAHSCNPKGTIQYSSDVYRIRHMCWLGIPYRIKRMMFSFSRSTLMRSKGLAVHYTDNVEKIKERYNYFSNNKIDIRTLHRELYPRIGLLTRCKNEVYIKEFCKWYLSQGINEIYILDDNSIKQHIYDSIQNDPRIIIYKEQNIIQKNLAQITYEKLRDKFEWMIYVDVDEYICPKKSPKNTIRIELQSTFKDVHCVQVPWVMMSFNKQESYPESLLRTNVWRWNHDLKHTKSPSKKFGCRYNQIETKSIFKPKYFNRITDHKPDKPTIDDVIYSFSVYNNYKKNDYPYYPNLREKDIKNAFLVCYHYRLTCVEQIKEKDVNNYWYKNQFTVEEILVCDYPEIKDETMKNHAEKHKL